MTMRLLITGAQGQLGQELQACLAAGEAEIGPIDPSYADAKIDAVDFEELDISDASAVERWFATHGPYDLIINCAAITNVDGCETNEALAYAVNADGPKHLAQAAQASGAKLIHVSTDYVFAGTEPTSRTEEDAPCPISAYGRTKWAGEVLARAACDRLFIVRTAWLYGPGTKNFVHTMRRLGATHEEITVVDDQIGNPTSANDLAYEILQLAQTDGYGTYHCTNEGSCSWAEFAQAIMDGSGLSCKVIPITSKRYHELHPESADRPAYSSLENKHLTRTIGNKMRPWTEALSSYLARLGAIKEV